MSKRKNKCDRPEDCKCSTRFKVAMSILGVGIVIGTAVGFATKRVFDEIFMDEDWSDEEWDDEYNDEDIEFIIE